MRWARSKLDVTPLKSFVDGAVPFPWRKSGLLFSSQDDGFTHGSHPCIVQLEGTRYIIAFTRRDTVRKSHVFLVEAEVSEGKIALTSAPKQALSPGPPCHFDCDGVISVCLVENEGSYFLYYVGWQNLPEGLWQCDTGRARLDPHRLTLTREFAGPVLGRDKDNPLFAAATAFHVSDGLWQTWYNSGISWQKTEAGWKHHYGIHYAESRDGIEWMCHPGMCLPFRDEHEYAFGRPSVLYREGHYFMWYAHRATATTDTYRIGFSFSQDGRTWHRADALAGITVADTGWDSEMICYPSVFEHEGLFYMLYNGNNYGATGFGLAVMDIQ